MTQEEIEKAIADLKRKVAEVDQYTALLTRMKRDMEMRGSFAPPPRTDSSRGDSPGPPGTVIFNTDDGTLNVWDGTQWTVPDGTPT